MPAAAVQTYDSLSDSILQYSERPDDARLIAEVPNIIMLAENEVAADMRALNNELVVTTTLTPGDPVVPKPSYWRVTTSLTITVPGVGRVDLHKRTYEYLRNFWPLPADTGRPRFYAEYNAKNFLIAPTPDAAYALELIYFARLDPLSSANQTNWTTENAPQLLLYSCMYHASLFLKNFDKAEVWKGHYTTALQSLQTEDSARSYDRTTNEG